MALRTTPILSPEEARQLHYDALVIDSQQPGATTGLLFTEPMRAMLSEYAKQGMSRGEAKLHLEEVVAQELRSSPEARHAYLEIWNRSGVTIACGTYSSVERPSLAYERALRGISQAHSIVDSLDGELLLVRRAADIERAHKEGKHGLILDFQNATPFGDSLDRINQFEHLGVRMVQLTYNLRNLVGDGCTEAHQGGLSYFGRDVVRRLNDLNMLVDVSHCSEQVGWDAIEVSSAPVIISHASSASLCRHDRAKSDELAKAVANQGGYFGVVILAGFIQESTEATLNDFVHHIEHLVNVAGIDHVGIGSDKTGPGPGTESLIEYPDDMPLRSRGAFDWRGFRREHRLGPEYSLKNYGSFGDWPQITVHLAQAGFNEEELRKLLGLNYLRVFRDVVG
jgi:membrane dipeptidase